MNETSLRILEEAHDKRVQEFIALLEDIGGRCAQRAEKLRETPNFPMRKTFLEKELGQIPQFIAEIHDLRRDISSGRPAPKEVEKDAIKYESKNESSSL